MTPMRYIPLAAILLLFLAGCADCTIKIVATDISPDNTRRAVAFQRLCGFPRGASTHVSLVRQQVEGIPESRGNILVVDEKLDVSVEWVSSRHLAIHVPPTDQVEVQTSRFDNIRIVYQ